MCIRDSIAQGSACLAYFLQNRHNEKDAQVAVPAVISAYLGVTEPAIFGINMKYFYPFISAMIGSGIAGLFSMSFNCMAAGVGVGGLPGILSMPVSYTHLQAENPVFQNPAGVYRHPDQIKKPLVLIS